MDKNEISTDDTGNSFTDRAISRVHKFYLSGEIKSPSEYIQWFEIIRNASANDVVIVHINSSGGDLFTAIQFMRVFNETKANTVASVEGACMSAATIIFLSAKHWEISDHSMFMFHNYSNVAFGKGGEIYDCVTHFQTWSKTLWQDIYKGFLTNTEISSIIENKDIWMSGDEVSKRLEKNAANVAKASKKNVTEVKKKKSSNVAKASKKNVTEVKKKKSS